MKIELTGNIYYFERIFSNLPRDLIQCADQITPTLATFNVVHPRLVISERSVSYDANVGRLVFSVHIVYHIVEFIGRNEDCLPRRISVVHCFCRVSVIPCTTGS